MPKTYKYIHIIGLNELKFSTRLLSYFSNEGNEINPDDHYFATPHKSVYDELSKQYPGKIEFIPHRAYNNGTWDGNLINELAPYCSFLFIHHLCTPLQLIKVKPYYYKKIVWRTWGSDAWYHYREKAVLSNIAKWIINHTACRWIVRGFVLIGIANDVDFIDISKRFGNVKMKIMSYGAVDRYSKLISIQNEMYSQQSECLNILVGRSGYPPENHLQIMDILKKYRNENIKLYIPLSYGDKTYIQRVKDYALKEFKDKVVMLEEFIEYEEYARLLSRMDIAIIDEKGSCALGNISLLLFFDKKIFLNRKGIIKAAFDLNGLPYGIVNEISEMTFKDFSVPVCYDNVSKNSMMVKPYREIVEEWNDVFSYLDSIN